MLTHADQDPRPADRGDQRPESRPSRQFIARMEIIEKLQRSRPEIVHRLRPDREDAARRGLSHRRHAESGDHLKFEGVAQSSTRVSAFMRNIDASQWLKNPDPRGDPVRARGVRLELHARCRADRRRCRRRQWTRAWWRTRGGRVDEPQPELSRGAARPRPARSRALAAARARRSCRYDVRRADPGADLLLRLGRACARTCSRRRTRSSRCGRSSSTSMRRP